MLNTLIQEGFIAPKRRIVSKSIQYNSAITHYTHVLFFLRSTNYILLILCRRLSLLCVVLAMLVLLSHSISHTYTYVDVVI